MRTSGCPFNTWYKYIEAYTTVDTVGCTRIWKRFSGETEKQGFFQKAEPYTTVDTVPYTHMEADFDFGGGRPLAKKTSSAPANVTVRMTRSCAFSPYGVRRLIGIMSTSNPCNYLFYQQLPKTGNFMQRYFYYGAYFPDIIPKGHQKQAQYPIYAIFMAILAHRFPAFVFWNYGVSQ